MLILRALRNRTGASSNDRRAKSMSRSDHRQCTADDELVAEMWPLARKDPESFARFLRVAMEHFISRKRCRVTFEGMLREIIIAAEQVGEDGRGKDRLGGYLRRLARDFPRSF